jgi:hypothetical protein
MEIFNPRSFDPCNRLLKIWEFIKTPTPKMGAHLGVCGFIPSHFPTFSRTRNVIPRLHSWLTPLQALTLVVSPKLGFQHWSSGMGTRKNDKQVNYSHGPAQIKQQVG